MVDLMHLEALFVEYGLDIVVLLDEVGLELYPKVLLVQEVSALYTAPADLVLVSRAYAPAGGAYLLLAP